MKINPSEEEIKSSTFSYISPDKFSRVSLTKIDTCSDMTCAFELLKIKFRLKYYAKLYYTIENNKLSVKSWLSAWKSDPSLFNLNI